MDVAVLKNDERLPERHFACTDPAAFDRATSAALIVCEKMRERLRDRGAPPGEPGGDRERKARGRKADEAPPNAPEPAE